MHGTDPLLARAAAGPTQAPMYGPYTHFGLKQWYDYNTLWDPAGRCVAPSLWYGQYTHYTVSALAAAFWPWWSVVPYSTPILGPRPPAPCCCLHAQFVPVFSCT